MVHKRRVVGKITDDVRKTVRESEPVEIEKELKENNLISTGSTLLNLALSDKYVNGGYSLGTVVHIVGDTHAGKSLLALSAMAEASIDERLNDYQLIYEEPESAMFFPVGKMFGEKALERIVFHPSKEDRLEPRTVQHWHKDLTEWPLPFIWVTDSFDALTSNDDLKDDEPEKGGWKTEKAIVAKRLFPKIVGRIEASNSLYFWISQTIDNIGVTFGPNKTFSGGNAIKFYRSYEIWLAVENLIFTEVRGKKREIGANVIVNVKKNKFTGKKKTIRFPIYPYPYGYGIDDVTSMVNWMIEEKFWDKPKGKSNVQTEEPFIDGKIEKIVAHIEENNLEEKLKMVVCECWQEIEKELSTKRKPKY